MCLLCLLLFPAFLSGFRIPMPFCNVPASSYQNPSFCPLGFLPQTLLKSHKCSYTLLKIIKEPYITNLMINYPALRLYCYYGFPLAFFTVSGEIDDFGTVKVFQHLGKPTVRASVPIFLLHTVHHLYSFIQKYMFAFIPIIHNVFGICNKNY